MIRTKVSVLILSFDNPRQVPSGVIEPIAHLDLINTTLHRLHPHLHNDAYNPHCCKDPVAQHDDELPYTALPPQLSRTVNHAAVPTRWTCIVTSISSDS